jgi:metallo-beta-lactamase family protein
MTREHEPPAGDGPRIAFHGAVGTVTGSRTVVTLGKQRVLIDCGMFQGERELRERNWEQPEFRPGSIDATLITHAHLDHAGYIPRLVREGFRGPIFCTPATAELSQVLLLDSAHIQEEDAEYANRKGFSRHRPALPLYTEQDVEKALAHFRSVPYRRWLDLGGGIRARFFNSGHILGSSMILVELRQEGRTARLLFSGDLGRYDMPLHTDPDPLPACDALVVESTYGDRTHDRTPLIDQLRGPFLSTLKRGGTVLIPSFATARAQLVVLMLRDLMRDGDLPQIPIHVDSPMATEVTKIYNRYLGSEYLDVDIPGAQMGTLFPRMVRFHNTVQESRVLNDMPGPRIIIASSGMLTGGRVLHHLKRLLPDRKNLVAMVGYQAEGTRGRELLAGASSLRIHGEDVPVAAKVIELTGLSAHADQEELLRWMRSGANPPRAIFINHGEPQAAKTFAHRIKSELGIEPYVPGLGQEYSLGWLLRQGA